MVLPPFRPGLKWVLVASLGLNLLFAGLFAAAAFRGPPPPPVPGLWQYARSLPEPYRRELGRELRDTRKDWIGPREALKAQQQALAAALTSEPFDPAAVADVLASETRISVDLSARARQLLVNQIARMTAGERAAYAAALLADRGPPDPPDRGPDGPGPGRRP